MKTVKQKNVWIDIEVIEKLRKRDPTLSPNNHLRKFLGMELKATRGRKGRGIEYSLRKRKRG